MQQSKCRSEWEVRSCGSYNIRGCGHIGTIGKHFSCNLQEYLPLLFTHGMDRFWGSTSPRWNLLPNLCGEQEPDHILRPCKACCPWSMHAKAHCHTHILCYWSCKKGCKGRNPIWNAFSIPSVANDGKARTTGSCGCSIRRGPPPTKEARCSTIREKGDHS